MHQKLAQWDDTLIEIVSNTTDASGKGLQELKVGEGHACKNDEKWSGILSSDKTMGIAYCSYRSRCYRNSNTYTGPWQEKTKEKENK